MIRLGFAALLLVALGLGAGYWWGSGRAAPVSSPVSAATTQPGAPGGRRILYYRHPMGQPDTSPVPKKDSMGMDYVPVYADEASSGPGIVIPNEKLQRLAVRTTTAAARSLTREVRAVGTVQVDERRQVTVSPKFEGYVTQLYVATTGAPVRRGQPLLEVYSPELVSSQVEYRIARRNLERYGGASDALRAPLAELVEASRARLRNWDIEARDMSSLERDDPQRNVVLRSPADGVVLEKLARTGQRFMPGEPLYQIARLDSVWLVASVFEQDVSIVAPGMPARVTLEAYPGRSFSGRVVFVYPILDASTRTLSVRIELPNPDGLLKPGLYGRVTIDAPALEAPVAIPRDAVLDSGVRRLVFVAHGDGRFEPREVELGAQAGGYVKVLKGLEAGEPVVTDGNFLIDAESNLRAGTAALGHVHSPASPASGRGTQSADGSDAGAPPPSAPAAPADHLHH